MTEPEKHIDSDGEGDVEGMPWCPWMKVGTVVVVYGPDHIWREGKIDGLSQLCVEGEDMLTIGDKTFTYIRYGADLDISFWEHNGEEYAVMMGLTFEESLNDGGAFIFAHIEEGLDVPKEQPSFVVLESKRYVSVGKSVLVWNPDGSYKGESVVSAVEKTPDGPCVTIDDVRYIFKQEENKDHHRQEYWYNEADPTQVHALIFHVDEDRGLEDGYFDSAHKYHGLGLPLPKE